MTDYEALAKRLEEAEQTCGSNWTGWHDDLHGAAAALRSLQQERDEAYAHDAAGAGRGTGAERLDEQSP